MFVTKFESEAHMECNRIKKGCEKRRGSIYRLIVTQGSQSPKDSPT